MDLDSPSSSSPSGGEEEELLTGWLLLLDELLVVCVLDKELGAMEGLLAAPFIPAAAFIGRDSGEVTGVRIPYRPPSEEKEEDADEAGEVVMDDVNEDERPREGFLALLSWSSASIAMGWDAYFLTYSEARKEAGQKTAIIRQVS